MLERHPDRIHLIGGVSSGAAGSIILDCNGYGVKNYFTTPKGRKLWRKGKFENKPCVYIDTPSGEKVIIIAGGKTATSKDYFQGMSFGMAYITEANLCHESYLKEVNDRTGTSGLRKVFHTINPLAESHWYYDDFLRHFEQMQSKNPSYGYNWGHFTPVDNMSMSDDQLRAFASSIPKGTVWYVRNILGLRRQSEGLVYPNFNRDLHVVETTPRKYTKYSVSIDWGARNPFAMQLWGLCENVWYMVKDFEYVGKKDGRREVSQYAKDLDEFVDGLKIEAVIVDPSATPFIDSIYRKYNVWLADNAVAIGLEDVSTALHLGLIKINDCCKHTIREIEGYVFSDKKQGEDDVVKDKDHQMDAKRYFVRTSKIMPKYVRSGKVA